MKITINRNKALIEQAAQQWFEILLAHLYYKQSTKSKINGSANMEVKGYERSNQ